MLFTNAGMVPFKDFFLGVRKAPSSRIADCQKCLRISGKHNDLDAVGRDSYHHTFFEMLGNWSFGDYYKREAIAFHWELVTGVWKIPKDRLWATVYQDDDEAERCWLEEGFLPAQRVLRFGEKDNFWQMGETGPCGPCSEIHIDRGEEASRLWCAHRDRQCGVNVDGCARFIELANLVFIQYDRDAAGRLTPLPMKHVDTGTGLERVAAVLQSLETGKLLGNYEIDLFEEIILGIVGFTGVAGKKKRYGQGGEADVSFRLIADHARAITFLLAEGLVPGNAERAYVLRRLIRRAAVHGRRLGIREPFLEGLCGLVIQWMSRMAIGDELYPELYLRRVRILEQAAAEEARFAETLDRGLELLDAELKRLAGTTQRRLSGGFAFTLYDTYGFPLDLTQDIARDWGLQVDLEEFNRLMREQQERGRAARKGAALAPELKLGAKVASRFIGYDRLDAESEVVAVAPVEDAKLVVVTAETPFYPEGGGQVGDRGIIEAESGAVIDVEDTRKADGAIYHIGRLTAGEAGALAKGARARLRIDARRRREAMLNHSATHVLHWALREIVGQQVRQAGSLVAPERLRFDFTSTGPVSQEQLQRIEDEINARLRENGEVTTVEMPFDEAIRAGALAFFADKYGAVVRVVKIGDFSVELCGGTHVRRTGEVGFLKLLAESGVAAGVRRIEALTGARALEAVRRQARLLEEIGEQLGTRGPDAVDRLARLIAREKELNRRMRAMEEKLIAGRQGQAGEEEVREVKGVRVVTRRVEGVEQRALGALADQLKERYRPAVVAVGSDLGERAALVVAVAEELVGRVSAGEIVRQIAPLIDGAGGGRRDFAQAGGRKAAALGKALGHVRDLVAGLLDGSAKL